MLGKPNIFNIPANFHFLESLHFWLKENLGDDLKNAKIFLPNRRSCRELQKIFATKNEASFLPKIKAILDISLEDFFDFLPNQIAQEAIDELLQIKALEPLDHLFFLSEEIQKLDLFGKNLSKLQALKIAKNLQNLYDEIERQEVDLASLAAIDNSELSQHRLITLEFLLNFHARFKNSLAKQNLFSATALQNLLISKFIFLLEKCGAKNPLIIAGSTGSVAIGRKLICAIAGQKNCQVILHGLDCAAQKSDEKQHPQFFLNELLKALGSSKSQIQQIRNSKFELSSKPREAMLELMMIDAKESQKWQQAKALLEQEKIAKDLAENFLLLETSSDVLEAKMIAAALQKKLLSQKKSALICNNDKLLKLIKFELRSLSLPFNDSRNLGISNSQLSEFLLLILQLQESDFNSAGLLALLKHPLCCYSKNHEILAEFEIKILRQARAKSGLNGIVETLEKSDCTRETTEFFKNFCTDFSLPKENDLALQSLRLIACAENLSKKNWRDLLANEAAWQEIFEIFEKLKKQKKFQLGDDNFSEILKLLLEGVSYFEKSNKDAPIQILSSIEARLLNYDFVVICALNEGEFLQNESENWLGKKIRSELGIDKSLSQIGQSAYDFCNYLSNPQILLTRSKARNGVPLLESSLLTKFKTLCRKLDVWPKSAEEFLQISTKANSSKSRKIKAANPKPKKDLRPKKFSITEISKLLANPYEIYAKKILQLTELKKIDFEPSYAEFGSFVHKALEEFVKNPQDKNFNKKSTKIFEEFFAAPEAKLIWWPKFEKIFGEFLQQNSQFQNQQTEVEIPVKLPLGEFLISGKIDRIILDEEGGVKIFDYKTGSLPTNKDVFSGKEPQLTLAALALLGRFGEEKIKSLNYWKISSASESEIKKICDKNEEIKILLSAAKSGLARLFEFFSNEENGYKATTKSNFSSYQHLSRNL